MTARSIDPALIPIERAAGWVNFHPEDYCHRCGRPNIVWSVRSELWNVAVPEIMPILCPQCFVAAYEEATGLSPAWELIPDALTMPWGKEKIREAEAENARLRILLTEARRETSG